MQLAKRDENEKQSKENVLKIENEILAKAKDGQDKEAEKKKEYRAKLRNHWQQQLDTNAQHREIMEEKVI